MMTLIESFYDEHGQPLTDRSVRSIGKLERFFASDQDNPAVRVVVEHENGAQTVYIREPLR